MPVFLINRISNLYKTDTYILLDVITIVQVSIKYLLKYR